MEAGHHLLGDGGAADDAATLDDADAQTRRLQVRRRHQAVVTGADHHGVVGVGRPSRRRSWSIQKHPVKPSKILGRAFWFNKRDVLELFFSVKIGIGSLIQ